MWLRLIQLYTNCPLNRKLRPVHHLTTVWSTLAKEFTLTPLHGLYLYFTYWWRHKELNYYEKHLVSEWRREREREREKERKRGNSENCFTVDQFYSIFAFVFTHHSNTYTSKSNSYFSHGFFCIILPFTFWPLDLHIIINWFEFLPGNNGMNNHHHQWQCMSWVSGMKVIYVEFTFDSFHSFLFNFTLTL